MSASGASVVSICIRRIEAKLSWETVSTAQNCGNELLMAESINQDNRVLVKFTELIQSHNSSCISSIDLFHRIRKRCSEIM
jgi:hypothetical protein